MLVGKHISGRYKISQVIGGGGMSNVYLAHDIILNRDVAVKILRYDLSNEEELHRRFQREALSATSLMHPNIVSVYDVGEDEDMHYIVMEYIKGKTLKQYIQEFSPLSSARTVHIMKQLTSALGHAHENGIIHRDIKPQNILMDEDGNVKITDFGIATSLGATSYTQTNSVIGTVHYLSPEQARGGLATMKSDIYALGIVMYELLTGELPFSGESAVSIALKHLQSETPSIRELDATIPQSVENIVLKATSKDANHRYESAQAMQEDLETCLSLNRIHEPKFAPPLDDDVTKLIPIIKEPKPAQPHVQKPSTGVTEQTVLMEKTSPTAPPPQQPEVKKKPKKKWPVILGVVLLFAIAGVVAAFMLTPNKYPVPDVVGMPLDEAVAEIEEAGFVVGEQEERNSDDVEAGLVYDTTPRAGLEKVKGTEIDLIVSLGKLTSEMPDFVGKQIAQVEPVLTGYKNPRIVEVNDDALEGEIIEQSPKAGTEIIAEDTEVVLTVSKGKEKKTVSSLMNFSEAQRKEYERTSGFKVHVTGSKHSDTVEDGHVMEQTPKSGTTLDGGSTINVVLSKGPEAKQERVYRNTIEIPYEPLEEGAEQTVVIYIQDKTRTMVDPVETLTIKEAETYEIVLTIVEGDKAAYQIVRDNNVIKTETITYDSLIE